MMEDISTQLRWILFAVGVLLIVGLALAGRRRKQAMSDSMSSRANLSRANESLRTSSYSAHRDDGYHAPVVERRSVQEPQVHNLGGIELVEYDSEADLHARHAADRTIPMSSANEDLRRHPLEAASLDPSLDASMDSMHSSLDDLPSIRAFDSEPSDVPVVDAVIESIELSSNRADADSAHSNDGTSNESDSLPSEIAERDSHAKTVDLEVEQNRLEPAQSIADNSKKDSLVRRPVSRKIVALRLLLPEAQVDGVRLQEHFDSEQLSFGKYSIFHRLDAHGIEVFSVASMVEPGVFDLQKMDSLFYSGLTFFMQIPGPHEATAAYDQLLDCARNLEESLQGTLQDERGIPLSPLRAERIREEIIDFEHLNRSMPAGSSGSTQLSR